MKVLVAGGNGFIGGYLVDELLDRDHEVTVLARNPDPSELPVEVSAVSGDVTDYESIEGAVSGHDALVNLVALSPLYEPRGGNELHDRIHRRGTEHLLRAAESHDVDRFVQQSGLGADPTGPTHFLRAKGRAEDAVRSSDCEWVILRPSVVFGDGGEFVSFTLRLTPPLLAPLPGGGETRFQPIFVEDLSPMLADAVTEDDHAGNTYDIGGPEVLRLADVARMARRARGHPVYVLPVPMALAKVGLTVAGAIPFVPFGPDQYRSLQMDNTVPDNDVGAFGVEPAEMTRLSTYLERG